MQFAVVEAEQPVHGAIEEVAVVGHHHHAAAEILEEVFEHRQGLDVQIVGGLIQQQHVRGLDQQPAEVEPPPLAAGELAHRLVLLGRREQKPLQQLGGTQLAALHLHGAGGLLHHINHLLIEQLAAGGAGLPQQAFAVLVEVGQFHRGAQLDPAAMGQAPAGDQIQQGGFTRAVGANDADAIFGAEVVAEVAQQGLGPRGVGPVGGPHGQIFGLDRPFAQAPLVAGQADLALDLAPRRLLHGLNALDTGLLLGAAGLGSLAQPLQLAPQGPLEFGLGGLG